MYFDRDSYQKSVRRAREERWRVRGRARVVHPKYGAVVLSAANLFVRSLILQLMVYAVLVLAVVRAMSRNCQKRYEENMKFERAFGGIGRKFSFWKRKFADRKTHVYIKCGVCKKTLRLPKVKGEHTVKCPNCANKFKVKI